MGFSKVPAADTHTYAKRCTWKFTIFRIGARVQQISDAIYAVLFISLKNSVDQSAYTNTKLSESFTTHTHTYEKWLACKWLKLDGIIIIRYKCNDPPTHASSTQHLCRAWNAHICLLEQHFGCRRRVFGEFICIPYTLSYFVHTESSEQNVPISIQRSGTALPACDFTQTDWLYNYCSFCQKWRVRSVCVCVCGANGFSKWMIWQF